MTEVKRAVGVPSRMGLFFKNGVWRLVVAPVGRVAEVGLPSRAGSASRASPSGWSILLFGEDCVGSVAKLVEK